MRDPDRIPKILSEVEKVWNKYPDLRLGQLLSNVASVFEKDLFYIEDEELIKMLKEEFS